MFNSHFQYTVGYTHTINQVMKNSVAPWCHMPVCCCHGFEAFTLSPTNVSNIRRVGECCELNCTWPCCCSSFNCSAVHRTCYLSQTCCFQLSRDSRSGRDTLNDRLWKANWHLLLRCWLVAPVTTTVMIIIWPCWSFVNIWTSWPCSVISIRHSQKRPGHPS